jgi:RHS repeat-associated protein
MVATLGASLLHAPASAAAAADPWRPEVQAQPKAARGTPLRSETPKQDPSADKTMTRADAVAWPVAGVADIDAASVEPVPAKVGGLPIDIRPAGGPASGAAVTRSAGSAPQRARVQVFDRAASQRAGVDGPLFTVGGAAGAADPQRVNVAVGYDGFSHAIGGGWGSRLRLVTLPSCVLTTPEVDACRTPTPVDSSNNAVTRTVTADLEVAAAGAAVFALSAGESSVQGDFKATSLAPSSSWETNLATGEFSWSHPIPAPATPGGFGPQVALAYSAQSVDGRTSATNNQGSWIGEGFTYEPGYIERRYKPCEDDGHDTSADQCWAFHNGSMMLSGHSGELVKVNDNSWKLSKDDGSKIERLQGAVNGDDNGEHWKVTTTDGTRYYFGLGRLPGWSADKEETESTWTVPVYGDDAGEPCHKTSGFADSYCDQAWRWNLDYVVDPLGNVISYFYDRETNYFARGGRTDVDGDAYHRAGFLTRIDYGQRDGAVYSTHAPARVVFTTVERCIPGGGVDCDPQDLTESTAASWPDVPEDLICAPSTHCEASQRSATYFTRKRLTKIQTEISDGTGWSPVNSWALEHDFKVNDDASRTLWLKKITQTGHRGGSPITLPSTELDGIQLPNRIVKDGDNLGPLIRYRLATVKTDSGAQLSINYKATDCAKNSLPTAGNSTRRCFPVLWNPLGGDDEDQVTDWFHKHVVDSVVTDDLVGGNADMVTSYEYVGDAAWRKAEPDGITKTADLTWSDWRGYAEVRVRTGDGQSMPGRTDHMFLRGMSGGRKADGTRPTVTRTDSTGTVYTDHDDLSGHELEVIVHNGADVDTKTINQPWRHVSHTQAETWGSNVAAFVNTDVVRKLTAMPDDPQGGPVWRETKTVTSYNTAWGRVVSVDDLGEVGAGKEADDRCTRYHYADNPDTYMYSYVSRTQTVSVTCAVTNPNLATQLISDYRTSYDLRAWNAAPIEGTVTRSESLDRFDGTNVLYLTDSETTSVDDYGRALSVKDARAIADGRPYASLTAYTETHGLTTQVVVTDALGHAATTTVDPALGLSTSSLDANLKRTDLSYDSLGRVTAVWLPDRDRSQGNSANIKFSYAVRNDKTSVITTESLNNDGSYRASHQLLDGLLRMRQTQEPGPGGWLLTDTYHNGSGQAYKTNAEYLATGVPGDVPIVTPEGAVNGQTTITYDGVNRPLTETFSVAGDARWTTTRSYLGDRTHVDPPTGDVPTTTVVDARGQTVELHQYEGTSPTGPADVTYYTYTPAGLLDTVTDPLGNRWDYDYDQRGQRTLVKDPDSGESEYTYTAAGDLATATDAREVKVSHKYDALGRKVETWQGDVGTGTKLSAWIFDTLPGAKGQLHYSQRIVAGQNYLTVNAMMDSLYRPVKIRYTFPSAGVGSLLGKTYEFTTAYNTDGTIQSIGLPAVGGLPAEAVATTYDSLLRPTSLTGTTSYVTATAYNSLGQLLQAELHTGGTGKKAWLNWEYERGTGRLTGTSVNRQAVAAVDMDATYAYDAAGNLLSVADTPAGGSRDIQCFSYDHLRRLTEAWATASSTKTCADGVGQTGVSGPAPYHHSWTFDQAGNRDTETIHATGTGTDLVRDYHYPAAGQPQPHAVQSVTETGPGDRTYTYRYDPSGNTTCRPGGTAGNTCPDGTGSQSLGWNAEGSLDASTPTGGQATTYIYDADGNRIARKEPGGKATLYLPGTEVVSDGTTVTAIRSYGFSGATVAVRDSAGVWFQAADHHGTATCTINAATGAIHWRRTTPYGAGREITAPAYWPDQKAFIGGDQDPTGLVHIGAREYDPSLGRFISVDPVMDLHDPQQWSAFAYSNNNPTTFSDPTGLKPIDHDGVPPPAVVYKWNYEQVNQVTKREKYFNRTIAIGASESVNWFRRALDEVETYKNKLPEYKRGDFNVMISLVTVQEGDQEYYRVVGFVNKNGVDEELTKKLGNIGVPVFQAGSGTGTTKDGHSEAAARAFGNDIEKQKSVLGGVIKRVNGYISTNRTCKKGCNVDGSAFMRKPGSVTNESHGNWDGQDLTIERMNTIKKQTGLGRAIPALSRAIRRGFGLRNLVITGINYGRRR